ncbi:MAG: TIGR04283 family arsenosugar biosynthesis glycosyltransferase [Flavobacteriales bacterium]|nr:TIGR04283 family arsenosugar biosynthesis glycosyltransferase [Flavobacteriales bacterium]
MRISIIIPAYNEAEHIAGTVEHLKSVGLGADLEVIVCDAGSTDDTCSIAAAEGAAVHFSPVKGRAGQMNHGAKQSSGDVLYFVHADTRPPSSFPKIIKKAITAGHDHGSFRTCFGYGPLILRINAWFTRFDKPFFRGGDQSIWVTRELFEHSGGYKEEMLIMEEYDLLDRLRELGNFHLAPEATLISARKYADNSWLRVQLANLKVVRMYRQGASQEVMLRTYRTMLNYRKNAF